MKTKQHIKLLKGPLLIFLLLLTAFLLIIKPINAQHSFNIGRIHGEDNHHPLNKEQNLSPVFIYPETNSRHLTHLSYTQSEFYKKDFHSSQNSAQHDTVRKTTSVSGSTLKKDTSGNNKEELNKLIQKIYMGLVYDLLRTTDYWDKGVEQSRYPERKSNPSSEEDKYLFRLDPIR